MHICEDREKRLPSIGQGEAPQNKSMLLTPQFQTASRQNCEIINLLFKPLNLWGLIMEALAN